MSTTWQANITSVKKRHNSTLEQIQLKSLPERLKHSTLVAQFIVCMHYETLAKLRTFRKLRVNFKLYS